MVVEAISPQASEEQQTREKKDKSTDATKNTYFESEEGDISARRDKYTVAASLEHDEPLGGATQYYTIGRETIIERNFGTFEAHNQAYDDERRDDFEAREDSIDDASRDVDSNHLHSRHLYTESGDNSVYYEARTGYSHASQTPRSLFCEAFSFHRDDLALHFVFTNETESTVDESMNENTRTVSYTQSNTSTEDKGVPEYVLPMGPSTLNEINRSESSNYSNEVKDKGEPWYAPASPASGARIEMPWSPRTLLCTELNEQELNDVVQSFVDHLSESDDMVEPKGDEAQHGHLPVVMSASSLGNQEVNEIVQSSENNKSKSTNNNTESKVSPFHDTSIVLNGNISDMTHDLTEYKEPGFISDLLEISLLCRPLPAGGLIEAQELNEIIESLESNKSVSTDDIVKSKGAAEVSSPTPVANTGKTWSMKSLFCGPLPADMASHDPSDVQEHNEVTESLESNKSVSSDIVESKGVMEAPQPTLGVMTSGPESSTTPVANTGTTWSTKSLFCGALPADMASHGPTDAQKLYEFVDSMETKLSVDETEVVWDAHKVIRRKPMKADIPVSTCEKFQQDKIYSIRKATKSTGALVEVAAEAFWNPEQKINLNRRRELSRQKAAVIKEIRKEAEALRKEKARHYSVDTIRDVVRDLCFLDTPDESTEAAALHKEQAENFTVDTVLDAVSDLCLIPNPEESDILRSGRNERMIETEGGIPSQLDGPQPGFSDEPKLKKSELNTFKQVLKQRLSSTKSLRSKQVPHHTSMVEAVRDLCFLGSSRRLVHFEDTLLLETVAQGTKADASTKNKNVKKADSPVPESVQRDAKSASEFLGKTPPKKSEQTAEANHDMATEKQISEINPFDEDLNPEHDSDSPPDKNEKIKESDNAAVNKQKERETKLKPFTRVMKKSLHSSHRSYSPQTFGQNVELVKTVRDLLFLDEKIAYEGNTLLSETHAKGKHLLASDAELRKRHSLDEKRDPDADINEGHELLASELELRKSPSLDEKRDADADINEGYEVLASEFELRKSPSLDEKRAPDADMEEGHEAHEHGIELSDTSFPFNSAERTKKTLPIVSASDEAIKFMAESTEASESLSALDEDINIAFQAGIFAFNGIITNDELRCKIDTILMAMFDDENNLLIPASKELLPLYHVLKAMIAEYQAHGSASISSQSDACQLCAPLDVMKDLQAWLLNHFSPR